MSGEDTLRDIADAHGIGVRQVALAWLLHHSDNVLLIPGTSSAAHLEENIAGLQVELTAEQLERLNDIDPH